MTVGIIGAGTMGIGIAQMAATHGHQALVYDTNPAQTEKSLQGLEKTLNRLVEKGKLSEAESGQIFSRIHNSSNLKEFASCDLVIEAIIENREAKIQVFSELCQHISAECILASNTSSISITSLQGSLPHPERFIGIHFFNPAPLMPLVEVIPGLLTEENLPQKIYDLMKTWGKVPVIAKDIPGFIVNRIARPFYGEALRIVEENLATPQEVDEAMKTIGNFKMGPFELMDLIGIDVNFAVTQTVYKDYFFDPKYKPSLLQQRMVEAKLHGRKTGKGFYNYGENAEPRIKNQEPKTNASTSLGMANHQSPNANHQTIFLRIISMLINEAVEAKRLKIASDKDLELAMQKGVNYPKGLLEWGKEISYQKISETLQNLYDEYQEERYRQSPLLRKLINESI